MKRKIVRLVMLFALATSTVLAMGANQRNDEETKKMVEAMRELLNRDSEDLPIVKRPDGSEMVDLTGRFQTALVLRLNSDGTMSEACVTSAEEVAAFLSENAKATPDAPTGKNKTRRALK